MSHNVLDLAGNTPSRTGDVSSIATSDLGDVSGSPASTEALTYGGAGWAPAAAPSAPAPDVVAWLGGYIASYSLGSTQQRAPGNMYYFGYSNTNSLTVDGYHDLTYATWLTTSGNVAWTQARTMDRLQLAAGTYLLKFQHITYSGLANPYVDLQWQTEAGVKLGPVGRIGTKDQPGSVYGVAEFSATTILGLNIVAKSGGNFNPYGSTSPNELFNQKLQATILRIP